VTSVPVRGELNEVLFSGLTTEWHDRQRCLVTPAFSMSQMIKYEPCVDENISLFIEQLRKRFVSNRGAGEVTDVWIGLHIGLWRSFMI
jgi:cytochrome P450